MMKVRQWFSFFVAVVLFGVSFMLTVPVSAEVERSGATIQHRLSRVPGTVESLRLFATGCGDVINNTQFCVFGEVSHNNVTTPTIPSISENEPFLFFSISEIDWSDPAKPQGVGTTFGSTSLHSDQVAANPLLNGVDPRDPVSEIAKLKKIENSELTITIAADLAVLAQEKRISAFLCDQSACRYVDFQDLGLPSSIVDLTAAVGRFDTADLTSAWSLKAGNTGKHILRLAARMAGPASLTGEFLGFESHLSSPPSIGKPGTYSFTYGSWTYSRVSYPFSDIQAPAPVSFPCIFECYGGVVPILPPGKGSTSVESAALAQPITRAASFFTHVRDEVKKITGVDIPIPTLD